MNSVPSWNFAPLRRLNVHVLPSGVEDHLSARPASASAVPGLNSMSPSKICCEVRNVAPSVAKNGSNSLGAPSVANVMVPPTFAAPPPP